jgi:hypothetical protein
VTADWLFAPFFQTTLMAGNVPAEEVLTDMAMLSPKDALVPLFARSGEIAPFQMKSELLVAAPD